MKNNWLMTLLSLLILIFILSFLALPFWLVISFPLTGAFIVDVTKVVIPWLIILLLILVFNEQIKHTIISLSDLIKKTKKLGIGSASIDIKQEQDIIKEIGSGYTADYSTLIEKLKKEKDAAYGALRFFFHKSIILTIYRGQLELLIALLRTDKPVPKNELLIYHEISIKRNPSLINYPFERYLGYLKDNFLVSESAEGIILTPAGKDFILTFQQAKIPIDNFNS